MGELAGSMSVVEGLDNDCLLSSILSLEDNNYLSGFKTVKEKGEGE
jgi:hypothetical protein